MKRPIETFAIGLFLVGMAHPPAGRAAVSVFPNPTQSQASQAEAVERERATPPPSSTSAPSSEVSTPPPEPLGLPKLPHDTQRALPGQNPDAPPSAAASEAGATPEVSAHGGETWLAPRAFGLTLGDRFVQHVRLPAAPADPADLERLWPAGRSGPWLERQGRQLQRSPEGGIELQLRYQVVNTPPAPEAAQLEARALRLSDGRVWPVPGLRYTLVPVTATQATTVTGLLAELRPDRAPAEPEIATARRRTLWAGGLTLALLAAWGLTTVWLNRREARHRPLARAAAEVEGWSRAGEVDAAAAWRAVHRGLDAWAGRSLDARDLDRLAHERPALQPMRPELDHFFAASNARFFRDEGAAPPFDLLGLVHRLRAIERAEA